MQWEKAAMLLLKGRYRKLIELRYFEEYSYEEIAQELALSVRNRRNESLNYSVTRRIAIEYCTQNK